MSIQSVKEAKAFFKQEQDEVFSAFERQFPELPVGGFYNPSIACVLPNGDIEFRCHYDNYDNEGDSWTWYLSPDDMTFYN